MTHWAVVLYEKGKPPLFRVFPNSVKAYIYASWFIPGEHSILPVTKVADEQPNPPRPDTSADPQ